MKLNASRVAIFAVIPMLSSCANGSPELLFIPVITHKENRPTVVLNIIPKHQHILHILLDANCDGLAETEVTIMERQRESFTRFDTNNDGFLDFELAAESNTVINGPDMTVTSANLVGSLGIGWTEGLPRNNATLLSEVGNPAFLAEIDKILKGVSPSIFAYTSTNRVVGLDIIIPNVAETRIIRLDRDGDSIVDLLIFNRRNAAIAFENDGGEPGELNIATAYGPKGKLQQRVATPLGPYFMNTSE